MEDKDIKEEVLKEEANKEANKETSKEQKNEEVKEEAHGVAHIQRTRPRFHGKQFCGRHGFVAMVRYQRGCCPCWHAVCPKHRRRYYSRHCPRARAHRVAAAPQQPAHCVFAA